MLASRTLARPAVTSPRATYRTSREILPLGPAGTGVEAEMAHEYLPFSVAKLTFGRLGVGFGFRLGVGFGVPALLRRKAHLWQVLP